jgi:putative transposase
LAKCEITNFDTVYKKEETEDFNLEEIEKKALEQLRSGNSLYRKDGMFAPMLKSFLEPAWRVS